MARVPSGRVPSGRVATLRQNVLANLSEFLTIFRQQGRDTGLGVINAVRRAFRDPAKGGGRLTASEASEAISIARQELLSGDRQAGLDGSDALLLREIPINRSLGRRPGFGKRVIYRISINIDGQWTTLFVRSDDPLSNEQLGAEAAREARRRRGTSPRIARQLARQREAEEAEETIEREFTIDWVQRTF